MLKNYLCTIFGIVAGYFVMLIGGMDKMFLALIVAMAIDYLTGVCVALFFKNSPKTENGALKSNEGIKGLFKKIAIIMAVILANELDVVMETSYVRSAVITGFLVNETVSVTENIGLMGVPLPKKLLDAIEILKKKDDDK